MSRNQRLPAFPVFGSAARGFTLIELIVTLSVVAVLATIAGPSFGHLMATIRTRTIASDLTSAMTQARSVAVQRNGRAIVQAKSGDWKQGWRVYFDEDNNGSFGGNDVLVGDQNALSGVTITGGATSLTYVRSGRIRDDITLPVAITIQGETVATVARCVSADASGRPYLKKEAC